MDCSEPFQTVKAEKAKISKALYSNIGNVIKRRNRKADYTEKRRYSQAFYSRRTVAK